MFRWILSNKLAGGPRPRAARQRLGQVPELAVDTWIEEAQDGLGIRSIICFLYERELLRYQTLPADLLSYYRANGLNVAHIPAANRNAPRSS